ncbi:uncharacterized protein B0J16DRAFT_390368 [Fusarium flagelliforme]|uniref:Uncharacterized protein n=1 Tax=Fusarium flagelliforme TaxID=2675880 RepID=A0A395N1L0_9HYPO|nr:uncharacterized protein B0J16DRAFT_390368 [Fusarium flagelliforme]KAH7196445.1 hypothetical protein B0J16DRAFT_390368 [Fusarium flagelliforme]RFN53850.1 hypothetical protein FIE12Z_1884 [Fusarium flagelliforme]
MPTPSPKPSSPIPCARSRAQTIDDSWPPANNPEQGPFLPLQPLDNIPTAAYLDPPEPSQPTVSTSPLQLVDAMRLQTIHDTNSTTIGLRVVDPNGNNTGNVYAPLPLGHYSTGIAFSIGHGERMEDVYERAVQITGSQRIMGILFAPGTEQGVVRDMDWSFLAPLPVGEDVHPDTRTEQARQKLEMEMSPIDTDDLKAFSTRKEEEAEAGETKTSGEPEVEDTGIKIHHMIKEMMLEDKKDSEEK